MRFKERSHIYNLEVQGEVASANVQVASVFSEKSKINNESGYTKLIFSVD